MLYDNDNVLSDIIMLFSPQEFHVLYDVVNSYKCDYPDLTKLKQKINTAYEGVS